MFPVFTYLFLSVLIVSCSFVLAVHLTVSVGTFLLVRVSPRGNGVARIWCEGWLENERK